LNGLQRSVGTCRKNILVYEDELNRSSTAEESKEKKNVNCEMNGSSQVTETGESEVQMNGVEMNGSSQSTKNDAVVDITEEVEDDDRPVKSGIINGWFNEWIEFSCGGHAVYLKIDEVLFHERSPFQDILVFKRY